MEYINFETLLRKKKHLKKQFHKNASKKQTEFNETIITKYTGDNSFLNSTYENSVFWTTNFSSLKVKTTIGFERWTPLL